MSDRRHENYEILNLIGYGLAKFDLDFVRAFSFTTKTAFYKSMIVRVLRIPSERSKTDRIYLSPFSVMGEKAGDKKATPICIEKLSLTHYLQTTTAESLQAL